ncbi:MAG: hypothetical protein E6H04_14610 [Bacillati bacterium ANGP1]|uniref:Uncharacterized protein n=1 Tax=Candidatus Segetimicrobium genomatis TaxID=2569760 RepID=A0A537J0F1_9BACT|nr:MAG: hypothetical protein E6H04_14610 [Terrabacteria group bacterium ANGP1]
MRTMIALLVLGTSLALTGSAAFAEGSGETPAPRQVMPAQSTDFSVSMGLSNSSGDPRPAFASESHQQ